MFVDIIGASEISNYKNPRQYADFVGAFQDLFEKVCRECVHAWYGAGERAPFCFNARGDEGLLMIYRAAGTDMGEDVDSAIHISLELKRKWLEAEENRQRISSGLLPIELGIGIHAGKTFARPGKKGEDHPRLEGYAINLAKRVESASRDGRSTHIILSEAAHGHLTNLADEATYLFDRAVTINPKGISRHVRVFELKHHFLQTDWKEDASTRSRTPLAPVEVELLHRAYAMNPTNLWLAEELIRSSMLTSYSSLPESEREDDERLSNAFEYARGLASSLRQSDQRDAGMMFIEGLVQGECGCYAQERRLYDDAIKFSDQLAQAFWYKALSLSYEIFDAAGADVRYQDLDDRGKEQVKEALECFEEAAKRRPQCAWIHLDYACELLRWKRSDMERQLGISELRRAVERLPSVKAKAKSEPYLNGDDPEVARILQ